ncbi:hypothetical protein D3C77_694020 [compost metagenome]
MLLGTVQLIQHAPEFTPIWIGQRSDPLLACRESAGVEQLVAIHHQCRPMFIIGGNGVGLFVQLWYTNHGTQPFQLDKGAVIARWGQAA